jgi:tetratricopeptide (TPR) repeat protein
LNLGLLLERSWGKREEALTEYLRAKELFARLTEVHPEIPAYRESLAIAHNNSGEQLTNLSLTLSDASKGEQALKELNQARDILTKLVMTHPEVPSYQQELAWTHGNLGNLFRNQGKGRMAEEEYLHARKIQAKLAAAHPAVPDYQNELGTTVFNMAGACVYAGQMDEAIRLVAEAIGPLQAAFKIEPRHPQYRLALGAAHYLRAFALSKLNRHREALPDWERALELSPPAERLMQRVGRASSLAFVGEYLRAAAEADDLARTATPSGSLFYELACIHALNSVSASRDPARPLARREKQSEEYARQAVTQLRRAATAGEFRDPAKVAHLDKDSDLDSLRRRDDYRDFRLSLPVLMMPKTAQPNP